MSGVSHLEALELLSKECGGKVCEVLFCQPIHVVLSLSQVHGMCAGFAGDELKSLQGKLNKLVEAFAIDEDQDSEW